MSGDLYLEYIIENEYTVLKEAGAKVLEEIHHSNNYSASSYAILNGRLGTAVALQETGNSKSKSHAAGRKKGTTVPIVAVNRKGLPSHIYIELTNSHFKAQFNAPVVQTILERTFQPPEVISPTNDFGGWATLSADKKLEHLQELLPRRSVTLEIYYFRSTSGAVNAKLIDENGKTNEEFESFKQVPEKDFSQSVQTFKTPKKTNNK